MALKWAEMRMIRWTCCVKVTDRLLCSELRDRLGTDDVVIGDRAKQVELVQKDWNDWVKMYGL